MTRITLKERLTQDLFFLDGAMGTQLIAIGTPVGSCNDYLNIDAPETIKTVHKKYLDAGVDGVITNTFGSNSYILERHGHADKVHEINIEGARLARAAAGEDKYVLGDIGPCGDFLHPLGKVKEDELEAAFTQQAKALLEGGVDGFIIETMTALEEVKIAVKAIQSVCDLPILVSLAYDPSQNDARTMMGVSPEQAVDQLAPMGIAALGFNCGTLDMPGYVELAKKCASALEGTGIILMAEPNAGRPELEGSTAVYKLTPADFADAMDEIRHAGATVLGGCCGTTAEHIAATVEKLK